MLIRNLTKSRKLSWLPGLVVILALLVAACGNPAAPAPDTGASQLEAIVAKPTAVPVAVMSARDTVIFVTSKQHTTIGAATANCGADVLDKVCYNISRSPRNSCV